MIPIYKKIGLLATALLLLILPSAKAQLPNCDLIYFQTGTSQIYTYNPALPTSATNPILNTIVTPPNAGGLTVSPILGSSNPTLTFYTTVGGKYMYYNPVTSTWVNTGHTANSVNMAAGGGYIFNLIGGTGQVYRYGGTGTDVLIATVPGFQNVGPFDLVADCEGNWYIFNQTGTSPFLRKYSATGTLVKSWTVSNPNNLVVNAAGGFAIIGSTLFTDNANNGGVASYSLGTNTITLNSTTSFFPSTISGADLGSCAGSVPTPPSVLITPSSSSVCIGTTVVFTAVPTAGGPTPSYQWYVNNVPVGTNSNTYSYAPASGDAVTVVLTSTSPCASALTATSPPVSVTVNNPSISITASPNPSAASGGICTGTNVVFTATQLNGGANPVYQWRKNGINIPGANAATYSTTALANGDVISVVLNPASACNATSNSITAEVYSGASPSVTITASPDPAAGACANTPVTFTGTPVAAGPTPVYQWRKNGINIPGANGLTYSVASVNTGDFYQLAMTGSLACVATSNNQVSNTITVGTVTNVSVPSVSIISSVDPSAGICAGTIVTYTAIPVNGGTSPTFSWSNNGTPIPGATGSTYTTSTLTNGSTIRVSMVSNALCAPTTPVLSNGIPTIVIPSGAPAVSITSSPAGTNICAGTSITFTANPTLGGGSPSYQWKVNGINTGPNSPTFIYAPANGDIVSVEMTTSAPCATSATATATGAAYTATQALSSLGALSGPVSPCAGTVQTYTVPALTGAVSYNWSLPNGWSGTSTTNSIAATVGATGGVISVSASNICGSTAAALLTVSPLNLPPSPVTITGNAGPCAATSQTYTTTQLGAGISYNWTVPAGWGSNTTTTTPSITLTSSTSAGILQVRGVNVCGTGPAATLAIGAVPPLVPAVSATASQPSACAGSPVVFTATPVNGGTAPSYQWYRNGVIIPGATGASYTTSTIQNTDGFTVELTSSYGCPVPPTALSARVSIVLIPQTVPGVNINTLPTTVICKGEAVNLVTTVVGGGTAPAFQWFRNGTAITGATGSNYLATTILDKDTFTVMLMSNAACPSVAAQISNKAVFEVAEFLTPEISISVNPGNQVSPGQLVIFTAAYNGGGASPSIQWFKNGVAVGNATGDTYSTSTLRDGDVIAAKLTTSASCATITAATSAPQIMRVAATGIGTAGNWDGSLSIYPNPNNGHFTIIAENKSFKSGTKVKIDLVNALGQAVYSTEVTPNAAKWTVPVWLNETVANGVYQLRINAGDAQMIKPLLIQR